MEQREQLYKEMMYFQAIMTWKLYEIKRTYKDLIDLFDTAFAQLLSQPLDDDYVLCICYTIYYILCMYKDKALKRMTPEYYELVATNLTHKNTTVKC